MTFKKWITLQHLLIILCLLTVPFLIHKGIGISHKLTAIQTAERLFDEKLLIEAEDWYQKAQGNRTILYKEELISSRLEELAPITAMKRDLEDIADQASRADSEQDFDLLMDAYTKLQQVRSRYMTPEGPYSSYYRQLSDNFNISQSFTGFFKNFRKIFLEQLEHNLSTENYEDESFKWNLLRTPAHLFGTEEEWLDELNTAFQRYDETKLARMTSKGIIESMLGNASSMLRAYKANSLEAPWIIPKAEGLIEALLKSDWDNDDYSAFALHSRQFTTFASSAHPDSKVLGYAEGKIDELMRKAKRSVANGDYQEAIQLYTAIGNYQDTKAEISATELAWTIAEPVRLLPVRADGSSYTHVAGGQDKFGSKAYVAAIGQNNQLYWGRMNADDSVQILSTQDLAAQDQIRAVAIDPILSTDSNPVIVTEAASVTRNARYTAFEVRESNIALLYSIEADSLTIQPDGELHAVNPVGEGEGQTAIFVRMGDLYQFAGIKQDILDISADSVSQYPDTLVRFSSTVISYGSGEALAMGSNSLILLRGDFSFPAGVSKVTVTGRFKQYTEQFIDEQLMGKIEELLKRQAGGQMNEQTGAQSEEQSEGPSNGQSDGGITGWVDEQVDSLLNKLLRGLNEANQILIPVVEVETLQQ
ncbi:hypothetical protein D3C78_495100 [compost metagenome]